jgi:hypothetical protein
MTELTSEDVREVVRKEQEHMEKSLDRMAVSIEKMADFMIESKASERANEQKIIRIHERIDSNDSRLNEMNRAMIAVTTEVIPHLEQEVAKNSLSSSVFWKFIFMLVVPMCSGIGTVLYLFQESQRAQLNAIIQALGNMSGG